MKQLQKKAFEEKRRAISEAFHTFHQPLTSLHCGLEIALLKQRSAPEYRERVQEALAHAGTILKLNKALRELVEAGDPGEKFGRVSVREVIARVIESVLVVAEPALVALLPGEIPDAVIDCDPSKLVHALGQILAYLVTDYDPGSCIKLTSAVVADTYCLKISSEGKRREAPQEDIEAKLRSIAVDAAAIYCQTIGGECKVVDPGKIEVRLLLAK